MKNFLLLVAFTTSINLMAQTSPFKMEKNGISVSAADASADFPDAHLLLDQTLFFSKENLDTGKNVFQFQVDQFALGAQTPDAGTKLCANSAKGQHIHFILDNAPYVASYSNEISSNLKPGHHVLLAFLSRSYHESIKHKKAFVLKEFNAGNGKVTDTFNSSMPQLFYSRPKGEYIGAKETGRVMLDFYILNCKLTDKGFKVRATINGTEFLLPKWQPYVMEGLPLGENKIRLELIDASGKPVKCAYNGVERSFKLSPDEPLRK
ncbi:MAG: hypothetical protein U0T73_09040 [Chitinophagales bacterium]